MRHHPFRRPSTAALFALATLSLTAAVSAQTTVYTENFDSGYATGNTFSDQQGWTTNDGYTGGAYTYNGNQTGAIGESDYVGYLSNFSPTGTNYSAFLGGGFGQAVAPGVGANTTVTNSHALPTGTAATVNFGVDFQVTNPNTAFPSHDNFGFALTGATGTLVSLNFVAQSVTTSGSDNITYNTALNPANPAVSNGTATGFGFNLGTNSRYRLSISVNVTAGTFSASYQAETLAGLPTGLVQALATNVAYGTGAVTGYNVNWTLADKTSVALASNPTTAGTNNVAHTDAGINALYFDNVLVSIPEPSTYALLGLGAFGLAMAVRRARVA